MGIISDRIAEVRRVAQGARWQVETVGRVGRKLGLHTSIRLPGARLLARELFIKRRVNASTVFRFHAANTPEQTALIQAGLPGSKDPSGPEIARLSYAEVERRADLFASALHRRGIGRGSAIVVLLKNRIEYFLVALGALRSGAAQVTVSWRSTVPEIEYFARHSGAEAVFFDADIAGTLRDAAPKLLGVPRRNLISVGGEAAGFVSFEEFLATGDALRDDGSNEGRSVMYTSGTTGKPKGATRKLAGGILPQALSFVEQTPMGVGEVHLTVCPLYHATATGFSNFVFLLGGTVVVLADFRPDTFLDVVERHGATSTALVPTMIHRIIEHGGEAATMRAKTASLRAIFSGGAPLPGALAVEAMDVLGDKIYNFYGATETGLVTIASPSDLRGAPGTIGRLVPGNEVRLVDERGRDVPVGAVGELYARSPMMVDGYHADAAATKSSMLDGYFSVGDLARKDHEGRFHIEGRKRDMIISGGVNVYPAEVEAALEAHPAVGEVAVVGVSDREWGERVRAFVVRRTGHDVSADDLRAHCRARLAGPKVPRDYVFLESLPRNPTGKILKRDLRTMAVE